MDSREKRNGVPIEVLGDYDPMKHAGKINSDRYTHWTKNGAQPSDRVNSIFAKLVKS